MRCAALLMNVWVAIGCLAAETPPSTAPSSAPANATTLATGPAHNAMSADAIDAAKRFAVAFSNPSRDALRATVAGRTPLEEQAADLWADSMSAQFRLQETIRKRFGDDGYALVFGRSPRPPPVPDQAQKQIEQVFSTASAELGQSEARVTVSAGGRSEQLWLTRTPDGWKMWIAAVLQARSIDLLDNYVRHNAGYARVRNQIADEIDAGLITGAREARHALNLLEDEEAARSDPATTRVTTPEQGKLELREKLRKMQEIETERDRLERQAATRPLQ